jgi:hypothetical protein
LAGKQQRTLDATARAVLRNIDHDEVYFLQTGQRIIDAASRPYHEGQPLVAAIARELEMLKESPDDPIVARQLLADVEVARRCQAEDAARCQAWLTALSVATDRPLATALINPLTGEPLVANRITGNVVRVQIDGVDDSPIEFRIAPPVLIHRG